MLRFSSCQPGIYVIKFLIKFLPNSFSSHWWFFFSYIHDFIRSLGSFKIHKTDFPGGSEVKNLPCNARDTSSIPGPGRPHMPQQQKPTHPGACIAQQEKPPQWEALAPQLESSPRSPQLEKASVQQRRPSRVKHFFNKCINIFKNPIRLRYF